MSLFRDIFILPIRSMVKARAKAATEAALESGAAKGVLASFASTKIGKSALIGAGALIGVPIVTILGIGAVGTVATIRDAFVKPHLGWSTAKAAAPIQRVMGLSEYLTGDDGLTPSQAYIVYLSNTDEDYKRDLISAFYENRRHQQAVIENPNDTFDPHLSMVTTDELKAAGHIIDAAVEAANKAKAASEALKQQTELQLGLNKQQASLAPLASGAFDFNRSGAAARSTTQFVADGAQVTSIIDRIRRTSSYYGPLNDGTVKKIQQAYMTATGGKLEQGEKMDGANKLTPAEAAIFARNLHDILIADQSISLEKRGRIERSFSFQ